MTKIVLLVFITIAFMFYVRGYNSNNSITDKEIVCTILSMDNISDSINRFFNKKLDCFRILESDNLECDYSKNQFETSHNILINQTNSRIHCDSSDYSAFYKKNENNLIIEILSNRIRPNEKSDSHLKLQHRRRAILIYILFNEQENSFCYNILHVYYD